ncbi:MAG: hypothetical protein DRQ49_13915 [Gammaproteobacteria bacterium]|nr:MAG: hypothetical protein DRQ49_13915 [Gammaproteobacteria bacterium]RKZ73547.1 MAG: hypothetical protein DRQ57_14000 [Gammaproteobacteria bacterium]
MTKPLLLPILLLIFILALSFLTEHLINYLNVEKSSQLYTLLSQLFEAALWLSFAWFINRLIRVFIWDRLAANKKAVPKLIKDLVTVIIFFIVIVFVISTVFKQPVTGIWATSGIIGIILGFALQSIILDAFTGTAINVDRPYKIGDWIRVHSNRSPRIDIYGCVLEISWRTTRIMTRENNEVVIPNRRLGEVMVTNYMKPTLPSRLALTFALEFAIPPERAIRVLSAATKAVLGKNNLLEEPEPEIMVHDTKSYGIEYLIWFWIRGDTAAEPARHLVAKSIIEHLQHAELFTDSSTRHLEDSVEYRVKLLKGVSLFSPLDTEEVNQLAIYLQQVFYKTGDIVVKEGEPGETMFIVAEGMLNIYNDVDDTDKHKLKIAQIFAGQFFGEISLFTGQARAATVVAETDTILYEISKYDIFPLLRKKPDLVEAFSKIVAERRLHLSQAMESMILADNEVEQTEDNLTTQVLSTIKSYFKI